MIEKQMDYLCEHDQVYKVLEKRRHELVADAMKKAQIVPDLMNIMKLSTIRLSQLYRSCLNSQLS